MNDWKSKRFKELFKIPLRNGLTKPSRVRGSGLRMVNMKEIFAYDFITDTTPMELVPVSEKEEATLLEANDLLFARQSLVEAGAGKISIFRGNKKTVFESHLIRCRIDIEKADPNFIYYLFKSPIGKGTVSTIVTQTAAAGIKGSDLQNLEFVYPTLPEQKAIASVLSSLDDKIDLLHRQNKTLEAMAETLFRQWFVEEARDEDLSTLGDFANNIKMNAKVDDLRKYQHYVGLEHIPRKNISLSSWGNTDTLESNKSVFEKNDILFGKLRSYFHKVVFAPVQGVCSTDILVIRAKKPKWFSFCLFWFFNEAVVEHSDLGSGGTRMPRTNWEIVSSFQIPKPDEEQIAKFDKIVRPMTEKIVFNVSQIRTLEKLRNTLLPKLISGEVRVMLET